MRSAARLLVVAVLALTGCGPPAAAPPNVLLISIDTLRHDFVGFAGAPEGTTPHLDRLARSGVIFENAVSTTSWTLPSHVSLFTGQYTSSHGVDNDGKAVPAEKETMAELLAARGYRTAGFWAGPYLHPAYGLSQGFQTYEECASYRIRVNEEGKIANTGIVNVLAQSGVTGPRTHAAAARWLQAAPEGKPWFLFLHYWDPHADYEAPEPYVRYLDEGYPGDLSGHGLLKAKLSKRIHAGMPPADHERLRDLYRSEIRWTDAWIGRAVRLVERRGELDRTLIVVVADHGEEFFEHGDHGHRQSLYDESLRVPMALRLPGAFDGGGVARDVVSLIDVFATVASILGETAGGERQGLDLAAVLTSGTSRRGVFGELHGGLDFFRGRDWKIIRNRESGEGELFSLRDDPRETRSVRAERPELWAELENVLRLPDRFRYAPDHLETPVLDPETEAELRALGYTD